MQSRCCIFCIVSCPVTIFQNWSQPNCLHFFILLFILASAITLVSNLIICLLSYSIKYRHQRGGITFLIGQSPANTVPDCNSFLFTHICICLSVFVYLFLYLYICVFGYICIDVSVFVHVFLSMYWCFWIWMSRFHCSWNSWPLALLARSRANVKARPALHKVKSFVIFWSWNRVKPLQGYFTN